jgi:hypothetical protein
VSSSRSAGRAAAAADPAPAGPRPRPSRGGWRAAVRPAALVAPSCWVAACAALFFCYLRQSDSVPINSDGASNALQAWDMLHGNLLLRGWHLTDVSFYTTELPEYMLVELVRGLGPDDIHIAAAITYTLLVLLVALLARGRATGRTAAVRMLIAGGIMLAPQVGTGTTLLLSSPDHLGTAVPVLATWLLLDRGPHRWYVPAAAGVLLTWALVADSVVLVTGVLPLVATCTVRVWQAVVTSRLPLRSRWYDVTLGAAALIAAAAARAALWLISTAGGFGLGSVGFGLSPVRALPAHLSLTGNGVLVLFGADFLGLRPGLSSGLVLLHLVGLGLAAWAVCLGGWRFLRDRDLVTSLLLVGILASLAAYLTSVRAADLLSTREITAVLPMSAALAGRLLAGRLGGARLLPALAVVLAGYAASLGLAAAPAAVPDPSQQLGSWLAARHLDYGLAGYWRANIVTLGSGGAVALRSASGRTVVDAGYWNTNSSWYDPGQHRATFVVLFRDGGLTENAAVTTFGRPAEVLHDRYYTVLVWNKNLLTELR